MSWVGLLRSGDWMLVRRLAAMMANPARSNAFETAASCVTTSLGVCTEYTDEAFGLGESSLKAGCVEGRGAWRTGERARPDCATG